MSPSADEGPRWIRHRPDAAQDRRSLAVAVGLGVGVGVAVGAVALYLTRLFLAREPLQRAPGRRRSLPAGREGAGA